MAEDILSDLLRVVVGLPDDAAALDDGVFKGFTFEELVRVGLPVDVALIVLGQQRSQTEDERIDEALGMGLAALRPKKEGGYSPLLFSRLLTALIFP